MISRRNTEFFVPTKGDDHWSGQLYEPNSDGTDGPFATVVAAKRAVSKLLKYLF